jgi:hypothetical protein
MTSGNVLRNIPRIKGLSPKGSRGLNLRNQRTCDAKCGVAGVPAVAKPVPVQDDLDAVIAERRDEEAAVALPHRAPPTKDNLAFEVLAEVGDALELDGEEFPQAVAGLNQIVLHEVVVNDDASDGTIFLAVVEPQFCLGRVDFALAEALVVESLLPPGILERLSAIDLDEVFWERFSVGNNFDFDLGGLLLASRRQPLRERSAELASVTRLDDRLEIEALGCPVHRIGDGSEGSCGLIVLLVHVVFAGYCTIFPGVFSCLGLLPSPSKMVPKKRMFRHSFGLKSPFEAQSCDEFAYSQRSYYLYTLDTILYICQ